MSLYLRRLEHLAQEGQGTISSQQLGQSLGRSDAQVRRDLATFGQFGRPGVGYDVEDLITRLREIFGTQQISGVALVGVGSVGRAMLGFEGFLKKG
ncbi:hypothetical protein LCGC14_1954080, partial [marine sediment metagenome]